MSTESENLSDCVANVNRGLGLEVAGGGGRWGILYEGISRQLKQTASISCNAEIIIH